MSKSITIEIGDGQAKVEKHGFKGSECKGAGKWLDGELEELKVENKPELAGALTHGQTAKARA